MIMKTLTSMKQQKTEETSKKNRTLAAMVIVKVALFHPRRPCLGEKTMRTKNKVKLSHAKKSQRDINLLVAVNLKI